MTLFYLLQSKKLPTIQSIKWGKQWIFIELSHRNCLSKLLKHRIKSQYSGLSQVHIVHILKLSKRQVIKHKTMQHPSLKYISVTIEKEMEIMREI
jgi:hypothetical protein